MFDNKSINILNDRPLLNSFFLYSLLNSNINWENPASSSFSFLN